MYKGTTSVVPERNKIERALAPEETVAQPQQKPKESHARAPPRLAWSALPATYRIPDIAPTLAEARAWCKHLAETHYENFHVASWFLPKALRPHFHAIYAYCRVSDDLGDEVGDTAQSLALSSTYGAANSTPATKAARAIPSLSR